MDQVLTAVYDALQAMSPLPGTVYHHETHLQSETRLLDLNRDATSKESHVWLMDADVEPKQGPANDELYSIYRVKLRYLSVMVLDEEDWARHAKYRAELVRTALENNDNVFAIGGIQPILDTPKTVDLRGGFVEREGTRYCEILMELTVEARRWS
jgi:hypothetical protein